jgi:hypothetical protein
MPAESKAPDGRSLTKRLKVEDVRLTAPQTYRRIAIGVEPIELWTKVTGKIGPAVGSIAAYARDEALSEVLVFG